MFERLRCAISGHDWPKMKDLKGTPGKMVYFRCLRCGEPEAEVYPEPNSPTGVGRRPKARKVAHAKR